MNLDIPSRPADGHKGTFGSLAVIGGQISHDTVMLGSAAFVAKSAIRSGVGLVYFAGQKDVLIELVKMVPQAVGQSLDNVKSDAVVAGPGFGQSDKSIAAIKKVLGLKIPTVIDADGLNILASQPKLLEAVHDKCVLTPHLGEFERLAKSARVKTAHALADKLGCYVVLKGHETTVSDGQKTWVNKVSNPALATGGTGDVLAGLIGGLLAQYREELSIFDCACLGVQIHFQAGQTWSKQKGSSGLYVDELIDLIPETMSSLRIG
ncbi:MAG: NAD(P)H-hydrate dehydratase [Candidatus Saccharimonadales bacterium]